MRVLHSRVQAFERTLGYNTWGKELKSTLRALHNAVGVLAAVVEVRDRDRERLCPNDMPGWLACISLIVPTYLLTNSAAMTRLLLTALGRHL